MKTTKNEDDQKWRRPKMKTTKNEGDQIWRRPKMKTTRNEDDQKWRWPLLKGVSLASPDLFYRVSTKTVNTFISAISRLLNCLDEKSETLLKCPFRVDIKTVLRFISSLKIDWVMACWSRKSQFENQHFLMKYSVFSSKPRYNILGPNPRICIELYWGTLDVYGGTLDVH